MPIAFFCECGKRIVVSDASAGKRGRCPQCGRELIAPYESQDAAPGAAPPPARPAAAPPRPAPPGLGAPRPGGGGIQKGRGMMIPPPAEEEEAIAPPSGRPAPGPAPAPAGGGYRGEEAGIPAVLRANKRVAGSQCPACARSIALGDEVRSCAGCSSYSHLRCWEDQGGCASCSRRSGGGGAAAAAPPARAGRPAGGPAAGPEPETGDTRPCPMCGETIQRKALKCRFCNEYLDPKLREQKPKSAVAAADENLTPGEWVLAIICSNIACIISIVWMIQGKPKGKKLFLVALVAQVFWGIVQFAMGGFDN